ncbi:MAG: DUF4236 domain-containing protein [Bacillota bacterium]|nr:DUF4236 domain-containing protein [Bacillota bacterium]
MGFRFRKSIRLGKGMRVNLSKSGIGMSLGVKGARVGIGSAGARATVGIPGTGLYWEKRSSLGGSPTPSASSGVDWSLPAAPGCLTATVLFLGLVLLLVLPAAGKLAVLVATAVYLAWALSLAEKAKEEQGRIEVEWREAEEGELAQRQELVRAAKRRQQELQRRREMDAKMAQEILGRPAIPLGESPIPLGRGEVPYYVTEATLTEPRKDGPKIIDGGTVLVTSRKVYLLGKNQTISFGLNQILMLEARPGYVDIARADRSRHQHLVTNYPSVLAAHITKAKEAAGGGQLSESQA